MTVPIYPKFKQAKKVLKTRIKDNMKKTDYSEYEHEHTEDYYIKRTDELVHDQYATKLLYMIGDENGLDTCTVDKDKNKMYFKKMIIAYLKG